MRVGVLPFFLLAALVIFTVASSQFLTSQNIVNVARQSVYLVLVSLGQMLVLLTGGFDLAVGTTIALTSVFAAIIMISVMAVVPDFIGLIIAAGCLGAIAVALLVGLINGTGVAVFGVSPFIMTLGVQSVAEAPVCNRWRACDGVPTRIRGHLRLRAHFGRAGYRRCRHRRDHRRRDLSLWDSRRRHLYAVGGNVKAAKLSGINTTATLLIAYAPERALWLRSTACS